jgi:glucokinase
VAFAIGIDLGGTKIRGGLIAPGGKVAAVDEQATDAADPPSSVVAQIVRMVTVLCRDRDVLGVGVGVPGTVEQRTGTLVRAVNLPLRNIPLRDLVAAQIGEHRFGAATGTTHSVTLTLGTGVGGGIVADGRLFAGARGTGAELGHIVIERDGRPCQGSCPGHGHLEAYCSGTALGARGREAGLGDAHAVLAKAEQGDAAAVALLDDLGAALGAGLVTLANTLAPEAFVIAGGLGDAASHLILPTAGRILREQALPPNGEARLVPAKLGGDAGMIGAACLVLP